MRVLFFRFSKQGGVYMKSSSFVIQKYIEKPLLFKGRKFEVRLFVLLTDDQRSYVFKEGYAMTSSEKFDLQNVISGGFGCGE